MNNKPLDVDGTGTVICEVVWLDIDWTEPVVVDEKSLEVVDIGSAVDVPVESIMDVKSLNIEVVARSLSILRYWQVVPL